LRRLSRTDLARRDRQAAFDNLIASTALPFEPVFKRRDGPHPIVEKVEAPAAIRSDAPPFPDERDIPEQGLIEREHIEAEAVIRRTDALQGDDFHGFGSGSLRAGNLARRGTRGPIEVRNRKRAADSRRESVGQDP
jgi:hypothetical protein